MIKIFQFPKIFLIAALILTPLFLFCPVSGTESLITLDTVGSSQVQPAISGNWIVWADGRDGDSAIYAYNLATGIERRLTPGPASAHNPAISGDSIVWQEYDNDNYDIWLYDLGSDTKTRITTDPADQTAPSIDGNLIAWQDNRDGSWDIYAYDLNSDTETLLTPDTPDSDQINPAVSGHLVTWQDYRYFNEDWGSNFYDIFLYDTTSDTIYNLTPDTPDTDQQFPAISGTRVVWQDDRNNQYGDIYMNDTSTWVSSAVNDAADSWKILPSISGNTVVWLDNRDRGGGGIFDVYRKDLSSGSDTRVTDDAAWVLSDRGPKISGNRIVWTDYRNGDEDIFLSSTDNDLACPVADFTISPAQSGPVPLTVQFEDTTPAGAGVTPVSHWNWSFGDGNLSNLQNPEFTYTFPGNYDVRLTVDNPYCRNMTPVESGYNVSLGGAPVASFTVSPTSGMVPLEVTVTDTSVGATAWDWSFGDGTTSDEQNPVHVYTTGGTYIIELTASNSYGSSYANRTIHALTGAHLDSVTAIPGIAVEDRNGRQFLTYDGSVLPGYALPESSILVSPPLPDYGWQNITFRTDDPSGFHDNGYGIITGNLTEVIFNIPDILPGSFSAPVGTMSAVNYTATFASYPKDATLDTQLWEGSTPDDLLAFSQITHSSNFAYIRGIAYTMKFTRIGVPQAKSAWIFMSVNSTWVEEHGGRDHTYLIRLSDDRLKGEVLGTDFLNADATNNLDYFRAYSPHGLSTFALAQLSGSGNLFQLITLSVAEGSGGADAKSSVTPVAQVATVSPPATPGATPSPPQPFMEFPAVNATLYANPQGVITQKTNLQSGDGRALLMIGEGITALDTSGSPLAAISIGPPESSAMTGTSTDTSFRYAGLGYSLGPDGATFSPAINLTLSVPEMGWNSEYRIREYDPVNQTWIDLPTTVHPDSGTISASVSHFCCIGLFSREIQYVTLSSAREVPTAAETIKAPSAPPSTAVDIFISIVSWLENIVIQYALEFCCVVILVAGIWFLGRKKRRDKIRYLL